MPNQSGRRIVPKSAHAQRKRTRRIAREESSHATVEPRRMYRVSPYGPVINNVRDVIDEKESQS